MTFSERNKARCESPGGFNHKLDSWSLSDWMTATMGELGEAANIVKKLNRVRDGIPGNSESPDELWKRLAEELADTAIYLDLLAQAAGFDLQVIVEMKFQQTSRKIGYTENHPDDGHSDALEDETMKIMPEVEALPESELRDFILARAEVIVRNTQGEAWDDPEEWMSEAAELAHAVLRLLRLGC